jgi:hypothetical protein
MLRTGLCGGDREAKWNQRNGVHQCVLAIAYCRFCGAGIGWTEVDGWSTSTGFKFKSCAEAGILLGKERDWIHQLQLTPSGTPEQPGSCKPASTHGKLPDTSE